MTKFTMEIADCAYQNYRIYRKEGKSVEDALKKVQSDIREIFGEDVKIGSLKNFTEQTFEGYKRNIKKYSQTRKYKESQKRSKEKRKKPPNEEFQSIIDVIEPGEEVDLETIWNRYGGDLYDIQRRIRIFTEEDTLLVNKRGGKEFYRINPKSPFNVIFGSLFERKEREMDEQFKANH